MPWAIPNIVPAGMSTHHTVARGASCTIKFLGTGASFIGSAQVGTYASQLDGNVPQSGGGASNGSLVAWTNLPYKEHVVSVTAGDGEYSLNITGASITVGLFGDVTSVALSSSLVLSPSLVALAFADRDLFHFFSP